MKRRFLLCFTIILTAMCYLASAQVIAATSAKKPAVKAAAIPQIQTQCSTVLIQLEIMAKPSKSSPKLSDKIKLSEFSTLLNNAMSITPETTKISDKAKTSYITNLDAQKLILTALGYGDVIKESNSEQILSKASELGLSLELTLAANKQLTRGEAAVMIYNALTVDFGGAY